MLWLLLALAPQDPEFTTAKLNAGATVEKMVSQDLNGDGRPDLIVQSGKDFHVFLYKDGFKPNANQTLRLAANVFLWNLARVGDAKSWSLVTMSSRGLHRHAFAEGKFAKEAEDLVIHPNLFEGDSPEGLAPVNIEFTPDLNLDGLADALLFQEDLTFVFIQQKGGAFKLVQKLPIPVDPQMQMFFDPHQKLIELRAFPIVTFGDANGDKLPDIAYYHEESIGLFEQQKDGTFGTKASLDLAAEKKKRRNTFLKFEIPPWIQDLNGDGVQDIALVYPSKGRVHVYYGRSGRADFTTPDEVKKVADGWSTGVYARDLNGDGKPDMIMGVVRKFGIIGGIEVFLSGKIDLELHVYLMEGSGTFSKDPVRELKFSIPIAFHATRESASIDLTFRPNFDGDYNGDGLRDMIVGSDAKTLQVFYGNRKTGLLEEAGGKIVMDPPVGVARTEPFAADFNNDGKSDLVLKHVLLEDQKHYLEVKLSK